MLNCRGKVCTRTKQVARKSVEGQVSLDGLEAHHATYHKREATRDSRNLLFELPVTKGVTFVTTLVRGRFKK